MPHIVTLSAATSLPNQPAAASISRQPHLTSVKRKTQDPPFHANGGKLRKLDDDANDLAGNGFAINAAVPEDFLCQKDTHHTQRRQRNADAWGKLMPSLIYPLMAALHNIPKMGTDSIVKVEGSICLSGCETRTSEVKIVSFGGM